MTLNRKSMKWTHVIRRHSLVEYFDVDQPVKVKDGGIVTLTGQKRTLFWLCSCGDPVAVYDQGAYQKWKCEL